MSLRSKPRPRTPTGNKISAVGTAALAGSVHRNQVWHQRPLSTSSYIWDLELQACRFVQFSGVLTCGALWRRFVSLNDISAYTALPRNRLISLEHGPVLDHLQNLLVPLSMVSLYLPDLFEQNCRCRIAFLFRFFGKARVHLDGLVMLT
jgi:hypothetical protein